MKIKGELMHVLRGLTLHDGVQKSMWTRYNYYSSLSFGSCSDQDFRDRPTKSQWKVKSPLTNRLHAIRLCDDDRHHFNGIKYCVPVYIRNNRLKVC